ncbi:MAG TPA: outer membrane protein assembly factor BamD [Gammaproteobacteria bacterium]
MKRIGLLALATAALAACGRGDVVQNAGPELLYERGQDMMQGGNYQGAVAYFQQLEATYPFSNYTRQAQLDIIYAYYKAGLREEAIAAAEEFERENPTHPRVDYTLYMRGLIYFDEGPNVLERLFRIDVTARPPADSERAFEMFQELLRRFPDSEYAEDAYQRMVFLRNRLAKYENHVARYWLQREAYVAAINRAKYALETYPGAPELEESLQIMIEAYRRLGMDDLAEDAERVLERSFGSPAETFSLD